MPHQPSSFHDDKSVHHRHLPPPFFQPITANTSHKPLSQTINHGYPTHLLPPRRPRSIRRQQQRPEVSLHLHPSHNRHQRTNHRHGQNLPLHNLPPTTPNPRFPSRHSKFRRSPRQDWTQHPSHIAPTQLETRRRNPLPRSAHNRLPIPRSSP